MDHGFALGGNAMHAHAGAVHAEHQSSHALDVGVRQAKQVFGDGELQRVAPFLLRQPRRVAALEAAFQLNQHDGVVGWPIAHEIDRGGHAPVCVRDGNLRPNALQPLCFERRKKLRRVRMHLSFEFSARRVEHTRRLLVHQRAASPAFGTGNNLARAAASLSARR